MLGAFVQREWIALNRAADAAKGTEPPLRRAMHEEWGWLERRGGLHSVQKERHLQRTHPFRKEVQARHQKKGVRSPVKAA